MIWVLDAYCHFPSSIYDVELFQKDDLKAVVEYLRADGNVSLIGLWGRSMGAVTRFAFYFYLPINAYVEEMN